MACYRFRVKPERSTETFWRDFEVGGDRTLFEFHRAIVEAVDFDGDGLWFFGTDRDYWESPVKYQSPREYEGLPSGGPMRWDEDVFDAATTSIDALGLGRWDQLCYLFDYVEEWRFYATIERILDREPDEQPLELVGRRGDTSALLPRGCTPEQ